MNSSSARKNILLRIADALRKQTEIPFPGEDDPGPVFNRDSDDLEAIFTKEFTMLGGNMFLCADKRQLLLDLQKLVLQKDWSNIYCRTPALINDLQLESSSFFNRDRSDDVEVGITDCECLVARTGTIVLSSAQASGRTLPVYVPIHLVVATVGHIVYNIDDAIYRVKGKYGGRLPSALFFASGPSRTADIEKRLVLGVHGPKEVYLFLLKEEINNN